MSYLDRQQSLKAWGQLVTETQVNKLTKIQEPEFIKLLLTKLDQKYFKPIFHSEKNKQEMSMSQLYNQITKYYKSEIGTNIKYLLGQDFNIYSNNSVEDTWELMLGIAIKGSNRQHNINQILQMNKKNQQQLMRIVTKIISMFGENVSQISSQIRNSMSRIQDNDIIFQISEENEQLKQKLDEYSQEISQLKQNLKNTKKQLQNQSKFKKQIVEVMISGGTDSSFNFNLQGLNSQAVTLEFFRDVLIENNLKNREISRKDEKISNLEESIKQLKFAYSTIFIELEQTRKNTHENQHHINTQESELEELRKQNQEYFEKQKQLIEKIEELNEQKFYLKGIIERFQKQSYITPEKIDQLVALKLNHKQPDSNSNSNTLNVESMPNQSNKIIFEEQPQQFQTHTMKREIDETMEPSIKNKLQREVSHLQKKINNLKGQNQSLKKINQVLEKVINDFTEDSGKLINKMESQYEPLIVELEEKLKEISKKNQELSNTQEIQQIIEECGAVIKEKINEFSSKEKQYRSVIAALQKERNLLLEQIQENQTPHKGLTQPSHIESTESHIEQTQPPYKGLNLKPLQMQQTPSLKISPSQDLKQDQQMSCEQPQIILSIPKQSVTPTKIQNPNLTVDSGYSLNIPDSNRIIMGSFLGEQQQQQCLGTRRRQYSYMGNRKSFLQQDHFNFKQNEGKKSSYYEFNSHENINENMEQYPQETQIIDITEIEEELQKIKDRYVRVAMKNQQLYQKIKGEINRDEEQQESKNCKTKEILTMLTEEIKKFSKIQETLPIAMSAIGIQDSPQFIKICHQNKALKGQVSSLIKQRTILLNRLSQISSANKQEQKPENPSTQDNKQTLKKSYRLIKQLQKTLVSTNHQYIELYNYFSKNIQVNSNKQYTQALQLKLEQIEKDLVNKQNFITTIQEENQLLISTMLEWRNMAFRSFQSNKKGYKVARNISNIYKC